MPENLNADFSAPAVVHAASLPWVESPVVGVARRMLDRVGGEVARATSIVRYAPGSRFAPHTHGGGEEFLVLDGVFQDEDGDYPAGTYVRNPPQSRHAPGADAGCTIFVKLWQFAPADRTRVRVETAGRDFGPVADSDGVSALDLFADAAERVCLERWAPGCRVTLAAPGGLEALVLAGGFSRGGEEFAPQSWLRLPPGDVLEAAAGPAGCDLWIKRGHLAAEAVRAQLERLHAA
jgi:quercetin dioxygenase-like cupin family protein